MSQHWQGEQTQGSQTPPADTEREPARKPDADIGAGAVRQSGSYVETVTDSSGKPVDDHEQIDLDEFDVETRRGSRIATHRITGQRVQLPS